MDKDIKLDMPMELAVFFRFTERLLHATNTDQITIPAPGMSLEDTRATAAEDVARCTELIKQRKLLTLAPDKDGVKFGLGGQTPQERQAIVEEIGVLFREGGILMWLFEDVVRSLGLPPAGTGALPPPPPSPAVEDATAGDDTTINKEHTAASMHMIKNSFNQRPPIQLPFLFDEATDEVYHHHLRKVAHTRPLSDNPELRPGRYAGFNLTSMEQRVLEVVVSLFSDTNYQGDYSIPRDQYIKRLERWDEDSRYSVNQVQAYANNATIPIVRTTYAEILRRLGYGNEPTQSQIQRVREAVEQLRTQQYYFTYKRLVYDKKGKPVRGSNGDWIKEDVEDLSTLIRLLKVTPEDSGKQYLEIHPSAAMIDQVNSLHGGNHFLLIPKQWRIDLQKVIKRAPSIYEERFLMWCRVEVEQIRRGLQRKGKKRTKAHTSGYTRTVTWDELAQRLWMPDSLRKANRKRARGAIEQAYATAVKAGYLERVEDTGAGTVLHFNAAFYPGVEDNTHVERVN